MEASRTKNAKRNIFGGFISKIISMFFPFAVRTVLIYQLGSLYLGLNGLFTSILQVLSMAELGFGQAMVFSMYKPIAEDDTESVCALLNLYRKIYLIIGIAVTVVGFGIMPFLDKLISGDVPQDVNIYIMYTVYLANTVASYLLFAYKSSVLTASQRSDITSWITTLCNVVLYTAQIVALCITKNYYVYCLLIPFLTVLNNIIVELYTRKFYPQYACRGSVSSDEKMEIKKRVTGLFVYKICGVFRNSFDSIIISAFLGLTILAQYQNYYYLHNSIVAFMGVITSSITAGVGNAITTESKEKNYRDFKKFQFLYMGLVCIGTVCFFCLYQPFTKIWVGEDMMFSQGIMILFCVYFFTTEMGNICYAYRQAAGLWWQDRFRPIVEAITNLTLNIVLVKFIGVSGVILATIFCLMFINAIWGSKILFKYYFDSEKQSKYIFELIYFAIVAALACFVAGLICDLFVGEMDNILGLIIRLAIALMVSSVIFVLMGMVLSEHKQAYSFAKNLIGSMLKRKR